MKNFPGPNRGQLYSTIFVFAASGSNSFSITGYRRKAAKLRIADKLLSVAHVLWHAERVSRTVLYHVRIAVAV